MANDNIFSLGTLLRLKKTKAVAVPVAFASGKMI